MAEYSHVWKANLRNKALLRTEDAFNAHWPGNYEVKLHVGSEFRNSSLKLLVKNKPACGQAGSDALYSFCFVLANQNFLTHCHNVVKLTQDYKRAVINSLVP